MYYLLEGKIKIYENSRSIGEIDGKLFEAYHIFPDNEDIACLGKIKKQSENVYDLIDKKQDLIKIDGQIIMAKTILGDVRNLSGISAIYKLDAQGNYIKVWEKKDE